MSNYNNNNGPTQHQGKAQAPNKVSFSSVKHKENDRGSLISTFYVGAEDAVKLAELLVAASTEGVGGAKLTVTTISGQKYDSGYVYVNPKSERPQEGGRPQGNGKSFSRFNNGKAAQNAFGANKTKAFLAKKQLPENGSEE